MAAPIVGESFQAAIKHLGIGRALGRGFLLRGFTALILHLAAVEAHNLNARLPHGHVKRNDAKAPVMPI